MMDRWYLLLCGLVFIDSFPYIFNTNLALSPLSSLRKNMSTEQHPFIYVIK